MNESLHLRMNGSQLLSCASISSKDSPFVSGTWLLVYSTVDAQIAAKNTYTAGNPNLFTEGRKSCPMPKLKTQCTAIAKDTAFPARKALLNKGNVREIALDGKFFPNLMQDALRQGNTLDKRNICTKAEDNNVRQVARSTSKNCYLLIWRCSALAQSSLALPRPPRQKSPHTKQCLRWEERALD